MPLRWSSETSTGTGWHRSVRMGVGVEDTFIPQSSPGHRRLEEYELTQHYDNFDADAELIARSGASFVRYGLPWYRLSPEKGRYEWDLADRMIDALLTRGLDIVFDVVHYGTPCWLQDQFLNPDYPAVVADYAAALAERYGDRITAWTPLNEPQWTARLCGESGTWPPMHFGHAGYLRVLDAICRGIVLTRQAIVEASSQAPTFIDVEASFRYDVAAGVSSDEAELLVHRRFLALDLITGRVDSTHPLSGYLEQYGEHVDLSWYGERAIELDILGVNYYPMWSTMEYTSCDGRVMARERNDSVVGLEDVLRSYHARYAVPLMLTETSYEGTEDERVAWLRDVVGAVGRLAEEIPIAGIVWWPFMDQVKWQYREGSEPPVNYLHRLGLVTLDDDDAGRLARRPNQVFEAYRTITGMSTGRSRLGCMNHQQETQQSGRTTR